MLGLEPVNLAKAEIGNESILGLDSRDINDEQATKNVVYSPRTVLLAIGKERPRELLR